MEAGERDRDRKEEGDRRRRGCGKSGVRDRSESVSWPNTGSLLVLRLAGWPALAEPKADFHGQVQERPAWP